MELVVRLEPVVPQHIVHIEAACLRVFVPAIVDLTVARSTVGAHTLYNAGRAVDKQLIELGFSDVRLAEASTRHSKFPATATRRLDGDLPRLGLNRKARKRPGRRDTGQRVF